MNRVITTSAAVFSLGLLSVVAQNQTPGSGPGRQEQKQGQTPPERGAMGTYASTEQLDGADVMNNAGETIGEVNGFIVNTRSGGLEFVVVDSGGFLGVGQKSILVPWKAFQLDQNLEDNTTRMILNATADKLHGGFEYREDALGSIRAEEIFGYWGVEHRPMGEEQGRPQQQGKTNPGQQPNREQGQQTNPGQLPNREQGQQTNPGQQPNQEQGRQTMGQGSQPGQQPQ